MLRLISPWSDEDSPPQNPVKGIRPIATNSSARSEAVGTLSVSTTPNVRAKRVALKRDNGSPKSFTSPCRAG